MTGELLQHCLRDHQFAYQIDQCIDLRGRNTDRAAVTALLATRSARGDRCGCRRCGDVALRSGGRERSEEHTSELQSLMRISYAVFCLEKKKSTDQHMT